MSKSEKEALVSELIKIIHWLDGYRAYRCVEPSMIEKSFTKFPMEYLRNSWREIREDIYKIATFPTSFPEIGKMYTLATVAKFFLGVLFLLFMVTSIARTRGAKSVFGLINLNHLSMAIAISLCAVIGLYYLSNILTYKKIDRCYKENEHILGKRRKRLKTATQALIDRLAYHMRKFGYDPENYRFKLFNTDYKGISVHKRDRKKMYTVSIKT